MHFYVQRDVALGVFCSCVVSQEIMDVVCEGDVYACRFAYRSHLCVVWVGGHGVPDADTISGRPRKWITSNRGLGDDEPWGEGGGKTPI